MVTKRFPHWLILAAIVLPALATVSWAGFPVGLGSLYGANGAGISDKEVNTSAVAWRLLSAKKDQFFSGVGQITFPAEGANVNSCTGALIDAGGGDGAPSYVLAAGHCYRHKGNKELRWDEFVLREETLGTFTLNPFADIDPSRWRDIPIVSVAYATMHGNDLALFELRLPKGQLKSEGFQFYNISAAAPLTGTKLQIAGVPVVGVQSDKQFLHLSACTALFRKDTSLGNLSGKAYPLRGMIAHQCSAVGGVSGSPVFSQGMIVGVANAAGPDFGQVKSAFPDELSRGFELVNTASPVERLPACFTPKGVFDLNQAGCALSTKPTTLPSPNTETEYRRACEAGSGAACAWLAQQGGRPEYASEACRREVPALCKMVGDQVKGSAAIPFYAKACFYGSAKGCEALGRAYQDGNGVAASETVGAQYLKQACHYGAKSACAAL